MTPQTRSSSLGDHKGLDRRTLLRGGLGAALTPGAIWASLAAAAPAPSKPADPNRAIVDFLCDQTIPATGTPGALAAGVPDFVFLAVAHGLAGAKGDEIARLATELDSMAGGDFMKLAQSARLSSLHRFDAAVLTPQTPNAASAWPTIKQLILMGYYTSEIGASQELRYELVPGHFDPDVPYKKGDRAYSTDWSGVSL